jgi:hypothetical protein
LPAAVIAAVLAALAAAGQTAWPGQQQCSATVPAMPGCGLPAYSTCAWHSCVSGACHGSRQRPDCVGLLVSCRGSSSAQLPVACNIRSRLCLVHIDSSGKRWCTHALSMHANLASLLTQLNQCSVSAGALALPCAARHC